MELIIFIIIISVIVSNVKKNQPDEYFKAKQKAREIKNEVMGEMRGNLQARRTSYEQQRRKFEQRMSGYDVPKQQADVAHKNMQERQNRYMEENDAARRQVYESRMEARNTTILQRAKANADADKEDETLRSLEESHGHSAHVEPAVHTHPETDLSESTLGTVEDLIVKGYEGNLCFERDFLGEAMDMVSRFSLGGSVNHES